MVTDYLFHPLFNLWEEIISIYESLPQMSIENEPELTKGHRIMKGKNPRKKEEKKKIELMPKLKLSPPASSMAVDELEQQYQLKYGDPNFRFSSELKFLWWIADGLEAPQNLLFRGRFWPSLPNMKSILTCPENSYYVLYHASSCHESAWLKYDFRTGTIYCCGALDDHSELFKVDDMVIIFHSISHLMKALLVTLKIAIVKTEPYRVRRYWVRQPRLDDVHPPAIHIDHTLGFIPEPDVDLPVVWESLLISEPELFEFQPTHRLIPGHLTTEEYLTIRESICLQENKWVDRLLHMPADKMWVKRAPKKESTPAMMDEVDGDEAGDGDGDGDGDGEDSDVDVDGMDYFGFPVLSPCHLLDEMDRY